MTIDQILFYYGNRVDNIDLLEVAGGIGGSGNPLPEILDFICDMYQIGNKIFLNEPLLITTSGLLLKEVFKHLKKTLHKYDKRGTYPGSFVDYIRTKNTWELKELKLRFNKEGDEEIKLLMNLCFYEYDEESCSFLEDNPKDSEQLSDLGMSDTMELVKYFLLYIKGDMAYSEDKSITDSWF